MRSPIGSCTKLKDGLYRLQASYGWDVAAKKRLRADVRFRGTEREARRELARMLSAAGQSAPIVNMAIATYLNDEYLPSVRSRLKPHTVAGYESRIKVHIIPSLGTLRLDRLTPRMIDRWTESMDDREVSAATMHHAYQTFRTALRQAVAWGFIASDPTLGTHVPPMPDSDQYVLSIAEANDYLDAFAAHGDVELEIAVVLGLAGGLRRCEMCGAEWSYIDFAESTLDLRSSCGRHQAGREVWDGPLKSKSSRRIVDLPEFALEVLRQYQGVGRLILTDPDALTHRFTKAVAAMNKADAARRKEAGEPEAVYLPVVTLESLRNAHGSAARELGADTRSIADNLGHKDEKVTADRYIVKRSATGKRYAATVQKLRREPSSKLLQVGVITGDCE